jgi:hypothetical protein
MKNLLFFAAAAACIGFAVPASAQCPAGMALGTPGAEPVQIIMKYTWKLAEVKPTALKAALDKLPTVERTGFDEKNPNQILIKFKGRCDQISSLESAAAASGVPAYVINHAHVSIVLKVQAGSDPKGAIEALGKVTGALYSKVSGTSGLELHADLNTLSMDEIKSVVAPFKCDAIVNQSFEYVRFKVIEGKPEAFRAAAGATKGVMVVRGEPDSVAGMWINKAAVKPDQIEKIEGFTVKRL